MTIEPTPSEYDNKHLNDVRERASAIKQLFDDHNRTLISFLRLRLRSDADARDVAQEAYVRMLELDNLSAIGFLRAYLFRVAANIATDRMRHNAVRETLASSELLEATADERSPERIAIAAEDLSVVKRVVHGLPEKCRNAFVWHVLAGQSTSDIAKRLGLTDRMIRLYIAHALSLCKQGIDKPQDRGPLL
jgi:RNA polymerase sigma factor (sigma-70 family)